MEKKIKCPKCGYELNFDLLKCDQGTEIMCENCEEMIELNFTDKTPKDVIKDIKKSIKDAFKRNKYIKLK